MPTNKGQANARKVGFKHSKGEFVCSLDSDDTWTPMFLEQSLNYIIRYNLDLFFSNWSRIEKSIAGNLKRFSGLSIFKNEIEEDVFVFEGSKTDFNLELERKVSTVDYYIKYNLLNGNGYYIGAENDTIRENDTILVKDFNISLL